MSDSVKKLINRSFGESNRTIIDSTNPATPGVSFGYCLVLEDVFGFSCNDGYLIGDGEYPTFLPVGFELPSGLSDMTVTAGKILAILK